VAIAALALMRSSSASSRALEAVPC
jgi:hypothetical protein